MIFIDIVPFFRYIAAIVVFGLSFYFFNVLFTGLTDLIPFTGDYANSLLFMWAALPAIVLFFTGIRLLMVQQKRSA